MAQVDEGRTRVEGSCEGRNIASRVVVSLIAVDTEYNNDKKLMKTMVIIM